MGVSLKDTNGKANSEDPDQTAPLTWGCIVCPDISVQKLRAITIQCTWKQVLYMIFFVKTLINNGRHIKYINVLIFHVALI